MSQTETTHTVLSSFNLWLSQIRALIVQTQFQLALWWKHLFEKQSPEVGHKATDGQLICTHPRTQAHTHIRTEREIARKHPLQAKWSFFLSRAHSVPAVSSAPPTRTHTKWLSNFKSAIFKVNRCEPVVDDCRHTSALSHAIREDRYKGTDSSSNMHWRKSHEHTPFQLYCFYPTH